MKICKYCNTINADDAKICTACGANTFKSQCANCGTAFDSGLYCPKCGTKQGSVAKKCLNCGTEYFSNACPNCGFTNLNYQGVGNRNTTIVYANAPAQPAKKKHTWLWILGWIYIFPVPLTILMLRNQKLNKWVRIGIIAAGWLVYLMIGLSGFTSADVSSETSYYQQNSLTHSLVGPQEENFTDHLTYSEVDLAPRYDVYL